MASFHEVRFPDDISYGAVGGPGFNTTVLTLSSGYEKRNMNWELQRSQYNVAHGLRTVEDAQQVLDFFYGRRGRAYGFRYKDWLDYELSRQSIGTGNGSNKVFQAFKLYDADVNPYSRTLNKLVDGTVRVWVNNVERSIGTGSTNFSVDINTGLVTFVTAPTNGYTVEMQCEFDVPVRFDTDLSQFNYEAFNTASWTSITLVEVRV